MVDIIVVYEHSPDQIEDGIKRLGGSITERLDVVKTIFAKIPALEIPKIRQIVGVIDVDVDKEVIPSELILTDEPYVSMTGIKQYHNDGYKGDGVKVGVVGYGIDTDHPDFIGIYKGGVNILSPGSAPEDVQGHGTKVAGIIARIAPKCSLYAIKVIESTTTSTSNVIKGIDWCIKNGMHIINISLGGSVRCSIYDAIAKIAIDNGIVICASTGNITSTSTVVMAPACASNVVGVGAVCGNSLNTLEKCSFSRYGPGVDVVASGRSIKTSGLSDGEASFSGTSAACPIITGIMTLLKNKNAGLNGNSLVQKLISICMDMGTAGRDDLFGYGYPILYPSQEVPEKYTVSVNSIPHGAAIEIDGSLL